MRALLARRPLCFAVVALVGCATTPSPEFVDCEERANRFHLAARAGCVQWCEDHGKPYRTYVIPEGENALYCACEVEDDPTEDE